MRIENKCDSHENVCKSLEHSKTVLPHEDSNILKYCHFEKTTVALVIYAPSSLYLKRSIALIINKTNLHLRLTIIQQANENMIFQEL